MRHLVFLIFFAAIAAAGYAYYAAEFAPCRTPLQYRIGVLDAEFGLSEADARQAILDAEAFWEDAVGRELFVYDAAAPFTINFIFDARQERTHTEQELDAELDRKKRMSEAVRASYEALTETYDERATAYEAAQEAYEARLTAYNEDVAKWNEEGGAPEDVFLELEARRERIAADRQNLHAAAHELNHLAGEINALGTEGNTLVRAYNTVVARYNTSVGEHDQFTQGDYQGNFINIYQYDDAEELRLVLAHELGHSVSLRHVAGEDSVMYHLMGEQTLGSGPSEQDLAEFVRRCEMNILQKLLHAIRG